VALHYWRSNCDVDDALLRLANVLTCIRLTSIHCILFLAAAGLLRWISWTVYHSLPSPYRYDSQNGEQRRGAQPLMTDAAEIYRTAPFGI